MGSGERPALGGISHALVGVPATSQACPKAPPFNAVYLQPKFIGETPMKATGTVAIPDPNCIAPV